MPFFSSVFDGCVERGRDLAFRDAPFFNHVIDDRAVIDAADSLIAIKKLVFEERTLTMAELIEALDSNFSGERGEEVDDGLNDGVSNSPASGGIEARKLRERDLVEVHQVRDESRNQPGRATALDERQRFRRGDAGRAQHPGFREVAALARRSHQAREPSANSARPAPFADDVEHFLPKTRRDFDHLAVW